MSRAWHGPDTGPRPAGPRRQITPSAGSTWSMDFSHGGSTDVMSEVFALTAVRQRPAKFALSLRYFLFPSFNSSADVL
jgi:hypothetical protein